MTTDFDVLIVGAGPAGSAAAIEACRAGLRTVVIDKATFPRDKCCGDGLTAGALRHLEELGLEPDNVASWKKLESVFVAGPNHDLIDFPLPSESGQFAAVARRRELDHELLKLARAAGAVVHEGAPIAEISQAESSVTVVAGVHRFQAKMIIAADGMWSPTRKMLGLQTDGYRGDWHGFRQYFNNVGPVAASDLCVWFDEDLLPGYIWSFPVEGGSANVGFGILRGSKVTVSDMKTLWPDILERPHIKAVLGPHATAEAPHRALPIPAQLHTTLLTSGRVIFVGDAATATDPMSGEGIGQALETGRLAATTIAAAGVDNPAVATRAYEHELSSGMMKDHRLAGWLSAVLARPSLAALSLRICSLTPWTRRNFARWLFEDYPRAILGTPRRWKRGMFHRAGAYSGTE